MRIRSPRPIWVDAALAVGGASVVAVAIATSTEHSARPLWVGYLFACAFGLLMFARRTWPVLVVALACVGLVGYYVAGLPRIGLAIPVAAALYSAAEAGRLRAAVLWAAGLLVYTYGYRLQAGQDARFLFGYELATNLAVAAGAIAIGDGVRTRRRLVAEREEVIRHRDAEREADARRRVVDERLRIARELHDAVGHSVVALSLHANAAIEALDADDTRAASASMERVREAASGTMRELRTSVGLLRQSGPPAGPARVDQLVDADLDGTVPLRTLAAGLPPAVDEAAYRIVQESATNAIRHADPGTLRLEFFRSPTALRIHIFNDGVTGPADPVVPGHGLTGMRERAERIGGTIRATRHHDGFLVVATLPLAGRTDG